jgi:O-antigen ligase
VLKQVFEAPFFGHGYLSEATVSVPSAPEPYHAHSAYLATLRDGGMVGTALLLMVLGGAVVRAVRVGRSNGDYACLALLLYGMLCITTSADRLIDRPKELWLILWLPLSLLLTQRPALLRHQAEGGSSGPDSRRRSA